MMPPALAAYWRCHCRRCRGRLGATATTPYCRRCLAIVRCSVCERIFPGKKKHGRCGWCKRHAKIVERIRKSHPPCLADVEAGQARISLLMQRAKLGVSLFDN